jgi:hypothetical protein
MTSSFTSRTAVVLAICVAGCTPKQVPIPSPNPNVHPTASLDIQFGGGSIRTVTALATDPNLPPEIGANDIVSLIAKCSDTVAGCRNIQIFVDGRTTNPDGTTTPVNMPKLRAENPDPSATGPGATANTERLINATVDVAALRGTWAMLILELTARATNGFGAVEDTRMATLVWLKQAPSTIPNCPRFQPIGSDPPEVIDARSLIIGMVKAKNVDPSRTSFVFGIVTTSGPGIGTTFAVTATPSATLPRSSAQFTLVNETGQQKSALVLNGNNCSGSGQLLVAQGNSSSPQVTATSANATTVVFTSNGYDPMIWNGATFWLLFGGTQTTFTWKQ